MKKQYRLVVLTFMGLALLSPACNFPASTTTPDTETAFVETSSPSPDASGTSSPVYVPTASPIIIEPVLASIAITSPGSSAEGVSQLVSPITVTGEAEFPFEGTLSLMLTGEDGSNLAQATTQVDGEYGGRGPFSTELTFSVDHDQPGRISAYTLSMRDGGLIFLNSVPVLLLSTGSSSIQSAGSDIAPVQFISPIMGETISGGTLVIHGVANQAFENTLNLAVCGAGGSGEPNLLCGTADNILESGLALEVEPADSNGQMTFSYVYHFFFTAETPVRIAVYSISPRDGGIEWLSSVEVTLRP
ncbi:MAG TPA: Gmad2 immunoglobulin-like domain-containing protein [Longilinea sp.]|nr:Gmad2 immunoglobulin-like domain-containing protein [Longilinea sp.]